MTARKRKQPTRSILASNLASIMEAVGWTQTDLAKKSEKHGGLSQKTISNILAERHSVYLEQLDTLADTLGLSPSQLVSESLKISPQKRARLVAG
jgi:transcriptional regulator with XRE-family HTH domain